MLIDSIRLQGFRSYKDESFEFSDGVNIVVGPNASGKTNLLEAILIASMGSSYRAADVDLVGVGIPWSRLDLVGSFGVRTVKLEKLTNNTDKVMKTFMLDDVVFKRLSLLKTLPLVLFEPEHLGLMTGSPEQRRAFIDGLLSKTVPGFLATKNNYKRTLAQRNSLLKKDRQYLSGQLFAWNIRLSELGALVASERLKMAQVINSRLGEVYAQLSHGIDEAVGLVYESQFDVENYTSSMLKKLEERLELDLIRGFTTTGPHREDMRFELRGKTADLTASRGEARTIMIALKIIELKIVEVARSDKPLLLLDDVFSELDGARRKSLTSFLKDYQTFITTTDADVVVKNFMKQCNIIALT